VGERLGRRSDGGGAVTWIQVGELLGRRSGGGGVEMSLDLWTFFY
jgi:hypothetical protein